MFNNTHPLSDLNYKKKAKTMHRIPPKPNFEKMHFHTSDAGLAVKEYQQNKGFQRLPQTKERIRTLLLKFPHGIEMGKFTVRYLEAFEEELVPQAFGFQNLMELLKSLYEMIDMKPKVVKERKIVIAKSSKSKGKIYCKISLYIAFLPFISSVYVNFPLSFCLAATCTQM